MLRMNNYVVFLGRRGTGKSIAARCALEVIERLNYILQPDSTIRNPDVVRVLPTDTNVETMARLLAVDKIVRSGKDGLEEKVQVDSTGFMVIEEFATFFGKNVWNPGRRVPFFTDTYAKERHDYHTQRSGLLELRNIAITMMGAAAPDWFKGSMVGDLLGGGFLDRCIYVWRPVGSRGYSTPPPIDPLAGENLARRLV
jgi:hypothetical protein